LAADLAEPCLKWINNIDRPPLGLPQKGPNSRPKTAAKRRKRRPTGGYDSNRSEAVLWCFEAISVMDLRQLGGRTEVSFKTNSEADLRPISEAKSVTALREIQAYSEVVSRRRLRGLFNVNFRPILRPDLR
jgi:hypothetical protein